MDKPINSSAKKKKKKIMLGVAVIAMAILTTSMLNKNVGRTLDVDLQELILSEARYLKFEDYVLINASVEPIETVFLDAMEGGRVEEVYVESGVLIEKGAPLAKLSNTNLQLEVVSRQAQIIEQQNVIRSLEIQLEQNKLKHKREIIDVDYEVDTLAANIRRLRTLQASDFSSRSDLEDAVRRHDYLVKLKAILLETQESDRRLQEQQLKQLQLADATLKESLNVALKNLDDLNVKAPISGRLTSFEVKVGQSLNRGERIGQLDNPEDFKVTAEVDEFYLRRTRTGLKALYAQDGKNYPLSVSKVYPQVIQNKFRIELNFAGAHPEGMQRGQSLNIKVLLSDATDALVIDNGAFYQSTGGNWLFVMSNDSATLHKRPVRLGRRNSSHVEVLGGVEPGDTVIVSSYENFANIDTLNIVHNQ